MIGGTKIGGFIYAMLSFCVHGVFTEDNVERMRIDIHNAVT